jgi:RNA polymerase sigma factor (sigma-70 family)
MRPVPSEPLDLEALVRASVGGDREAVHALVLAIQDDVYGLAIRMLWRPEEAEDATQEILVKVVTHLSSYRGESAFTTWVFRIAKNHLLSTKKGRAEQFEVSFEVFGEHLASTLGHDPSTGGGARPAASSAVEEPLLAEEMKLSCTQGMLLCLDREHRIAYLLGEVLGVSGQAAASILELAEPAYRKRLSRARARMRSFMTESCGLVTEAAACRCERRLPSAICEGIVRPDRLRFAGHAVRAGSRPSLFASMREEIDELHRVADVFRSAPDYAAPPSVAAKVRAIFSASPPKN